jgi:hypothetical protein
MTKVPRYKTCYRMGCGNPAMPRPDEIDACSKHGGETMPIWAVWHPAHGWLIDTGVGGSYSHDVDDAQWFETHDDACETLVATDIVDKSASWPPFHPFVILRIK